MTGGLLMRGMLAGIIAGLLVFILARWIGEPQVERAILFENSLDQAKGVEPEPEIVARETQSHLGLLTATIVDGTAMGGIFALVFAFAYGRLPIRSVRTLAALLAGLGFVALALVPALKYPANPPSVGNPETIGVRTASFFLLLAISTAVMVLSVQLERRLHARFGLWNAAIPSAIFFVVVMCAVSRFLPHFEEVPPAFPATLLWKFRVASLELQLLLWAVLGSLFGWLAEKQFRLRENAARG
jgi:predicted cobalt transporter CbtA